MYKGYINTYLMVSNKKYRLTLVKSPKMFAFFLNNLDGLQK